MNKLKKILSVVLSIGLVASTLVLPITAEAADGDFIYKYTFDEAADATGVFGTGASYDVVAGTYPSTKHASAANLGADDKIAMLTPTNKGTVADGSAGSYLFGNNHSDTTGVRHATLQFDMQLNTGWNTFKVYPASTAGCSARLGFDITSGADAAQPLRALNANGWSYTNVGTISRHTWYEFAIEFDLDAGKAILYKDGVAIHTIEGVTGTATPNDFHFQYGGENASGAVYVNNLYYYEGGYNANVADPIYPYIDYDFTDAADATTLTNTTQVAGLAGKDASDMVGNVTGSTNANGWGAWYTDNIITAEAQVYVPDGKIEIYAGSNQSGEDRPGVAVRSGKVGYVNANGWAYTDLVDYDKTIWHKVAIEMNHSAGTAKVYLDGELIQTVNVSYNASGICKDIRIQNAGYIDNYMVYAGAYIGDAPITDASTDLVTVSGTTVSAMEGVTLNDLKAVVTDYDSIKFYTDATLATETTDVAAAKVMLVNYGDLYKKYDVDITSPYGEKYREYDFSASTDITNVTIADGLAGKDASDKVGSVGATGAAYNWGNSYASSVVTIEAQIKVNGNDKVEIYTGSNHEGEARPGLFIQSAKAGYVNANGWAYNAITDVDTTIWNKVALTMDATAGTAKLYVNGELVHTETGITYWSKGINQDIRVQGAGYIDNFRVYAAPYVVDEAIVATATSNVAVSGTTLTASETADNYVTLDTFKAAIADYDSIKFYTDTTLANEAASAATAKVMFVKYGELFKKFDLSVSSVYGTKYIWYDFTDAADAEALTNTTQVAGLADKDASDMVGKVSGTTNANGWGAWYTDNIITAEADVYVPNGKIEIYAGSNQAGEDRPGVAVRSGKVGYVNANGWAYTDLVDYDKTIWHKVAIEMNHSAGTAKVYLDGDLIQTVNVSYNASGICKDIRVQNDGYIDNFHVYAGAYVGANEPTPEPATDIDFTVLKVDEEPYVRNGVEYVFVAVTTEAIEDISLYDMFACTDGVETKGIALSELMTTTVTGAVELGVLVLNVPAANAANFKAKLVLAD